MDTFRSHSRGRSQPSVRWANSRSPSHSPSRGFRAADYTADPAFIQVAPREPTRSRSRSRAGSRAGSKVSHKSSSSSSRSPSTDRYGNPRRPASTTADNRARSSTARSWIDDTARIRDDNGKVAKSSIAILGAIGAAAYVAHRTIPKIIPGSSSHDSDSGRNSNNGNSGSHRRSSSFDDRHDADDRKPRRRHHGEKVERHHRYTTYYDEELAVPQPPPRPASAYYEYPDGRQALPAPPPRSDRAEPAWTTRESSTTKTHFIDTGAPPAVQAVVKPGLYRDEDDNPIFVDADGRRFVEDFRSGGFWPGARLP